MYEALDDEFLVAQTWASGHPLDEARFYRALHRIAGNHKFSPTELGRYIHDRFIAQNGMSEDSRNEAKELGDHFAEIARVVQKYREANGL
jgi:hypothetical protein